MKRLLGMVFGLLIALGALYSASAPALAQGCSPDMNAPNSCDRQWRQRWSQGYYGPQNSPWNPNYRGNGNYGQSQQMYRPPQPMYQQRPPVYHPPQQVYRPHPQPMYQQRQVYYPPQVYRPAQPMSVVPPPVAYPPPQYGGGYAYQQQYHYQYQYQQRYGVQSHRPVVGQSGFAPSVDCAAMGGRRTINPSTGRPSCFVPGR